MAGKRWVIGLLAGWAVVAAWSLVRPYSYGNWVAETFPLWLGLAVLLMTWRRFPLTKLSCITIWAFGVILLVGGHYTYAKVPIGDWLKDALGLSRNHFDRLGHLMQGIVPALVGREVLVRVVGVRRRLWLRGLCIAIAMLVSSSYEIFEWIYAETFGGGAAETFLGAQGDVWDAQKDMTCALVGSFLAAALLGQWQDRQMGIAQQADPITA